MELGVNINTKAYSQMGGGRLFRLSKDENEVYKVYTSSAQDADFIRVL